MQGTGGTDTAATTAVRAYQCKSGAHRLNFLMGQVTWVLILKLFQTSYKSYLILRVLFLARQHQRSLLTRVETRFCALLPRAIALTFPLGQVLTIEC